MPQSLVLNLETQSAVLSSHLQGHALQQLFFNLVDTVDPQLGHVLRHDPKNRAYTLSAIQPSPASSIDLSSAQSLAREIKPAPLEGVADLKYAHTKTLATHQKCWWRISFLDDALFDHLCVLWNQLSNEIFPLGSASVKIEHISFESPNTGWASSCSYRELYEQASAQERNIHLQFMTPTAFHIDKAITPLPTAEAIFQPLRKSWNRYCGLVFTPSTTSAITPVDFDIQTRPVQTVLRNSFQTLIGCTGKISFRIDGQSDPLVIKRINALANFTQYCGIGINTCFGMGVVRRSQHAQSRTHSATVRSRPTA